MSPLEAAGVITGVVLEEGVHRIELVQWARIEGGEAASGESRCNLWFTCSATDGSNPGTCENGGLVSDLF